MMEFPAADHKVQKLTSEELEKRKLLVRERRKLLEQRKLIYRLKYGISVEEQSSMTINNQTPTNSPAINQLDHDADLLYFLGISFQEINGEENNPASTPISTSQSDSPSWWQLFWGAQEITPDLEENDLPADPAAPPHPSSPGSWWPFWGAQQKLDDLSIKSFGDYIDVEVIISNYFSKKRTLRFIPSSPSFERIRGVGDSEVILFSNVRLQRINPTTLNLQYSNGARQNGLDKLEAPTEIIDQLIELFQENTVAAEPHV
jgi:hypothetical protein